MNEISPVANNHYYRPAPSQPSGPAMRICGATRTVSSSSRGVEEGRDLLGYLYAKATIGEEIEGKLLERLVDANSSMQHTRAALVRADAMGERTSLSVKALNRRLYYLRTRLAINPSLSEPRFCAIESVKAEFMKVGSCDEMASHTAANYLLRFLTNDEVVALAASHELDHVWVEVHPENAPVVIMDAWSIGPAILKEDARYGEVPTKFSDAYDASTRNDVRKLMYCAATTLKRQERKHIQKFRRFWSADENRLLASFPNRRRHVIFSDALMEKTSNDESASDLSRHLRAIRVLRNLGFTTQDAARYREVVLQAYKDYLLNNLIR